MKLRALLVLGLLPGCFLFDAAEAPPEDEAAPDCICPEDACGEGLLDAACPSTRCGCETGLVCRGDEIAGVAGRCEQPCEPAVCPVGLCGQQDVLGVGCAGTPSRLECECNPTSSCVQTGGRADGICEELHCPAPLVVLSGPTCGRSADDCWSYPMLVLAQGDGEIDDEGALLTDLISIGVTDEADGRWLWFLTSRFTAGNQRRLARVLLDAEGLGFVDGSIESFEALTPPDVYWTYEFAIAPDGAELFLGLASPGGEGWASVQLVQFVRAGATFTRVGEVPATERISGWTHRPALLADGRTLLANRDEDRQPYLYERASSTPGDASFVMRGKVDLGPGFQFFNDPTEGPRSSGQLGPRAPLPGADGRTIVAERIDHLGDGNIPRSAGLAVVTIPALAEGPFPAAPLPYVAQAAPEPVPDPLRQYDYGAAVAFSPDGERLYQFRHGYFFVSVRQDCP